VPLEPLDIDISAKYNLWAIRNWHLSLIQLKKRKENSLLLIKKKENKSHPNLLKFKKSHLTYIWMWFGGVFIFYCFLFSEVVAEVWSLIEERVCTTTCKSSSPLEMFLIISPSSLQWKMVCNVGLTRGFIGNISQAKSSKAEWKEKKVILTIFFSSIFALDL